MVEEMDVKCCDAIALNSNNLQAKQSINRYEVPDYRHQYEEHDLSDGDEHDSTPSPSAVI